MRGEAEMRRRLFGITIIMLALVHTSLETWMYLGVASLAGSLPNKDDACSQTTGLVNQQIELCKDNPQALPCIQNGAKRGILECFFQFQNERWNCSLIQKQSAGFGPLINRRTKETAFIYAVTSAGVVHAVTQSCSAGNLTDCSCFDMKDHKFPGSIQKRGEPGATEIWKWGGCSDNVEYGIWFGRTFVDASETMQTLDGKGVKNMVNLHNNEAGRKLIQQGMKIKCRCHGVSGSCTVKTCWRTMPTFRDIGDLLKKKYEHSIQVAPRSRKKLRRKEKELRKMKIPGEDLVFSDHSPDYCRPDQKRGIIGTRGRECNKTSIGPDSCNLLCCGRGYNTRIVRKVERCQCKFVWCCYVKCKICESMIDRYTCK
ncbi:protein Wnt-16-like [Lineus longissimus]|uniref:protein Wnt-16-like n=1 Tax=Lineus longissimus TaxID=88925 RepID=UPI00315DC819